MKNILNDLKNPIVPEFKKAVLKIKTGRISLKFKMLSFVVSAIIFPALLFGILLTSLSKKALSDSIFFQQQEILHRITDKINYQIEFHMSVLKSRMNIGLISKKDALVNAGEMIEQGRAFSEISLLGKNGRELWKVSRGSRKAVLVNRSKREEFLQARSGRDYISQVYFTSERDPYIILSVPLKKTGYILVAKLNLGQMWEWISNIKIGESGYAFVVDNKGNLIAHPQTERVWAHSNFKKLPVVRDFIQALPASLNRWSEYKDERGREVVSMYEPLTKTKWAVVTQIPAFEVYTPINKMKRKIVFWTVFWTVLFLFIGIKFVKRITDPVSVVIEGARKISRGKLDIKLDINTGDEIEELARDFESMAHSLKQLEELKGDLTKMIVHDLKSPLSGIIGSLDYLESGLLGEFTQDQKKIIGLARKSSQTMLAMVQNLLDISRMEEGKLELNRQNEDLSVLFEERKAHFEPLFAYESKTLSYLKTGSLFKADVDKDLLVRVINNLLTNALQHTSFGGKIELKLIDANESLKVIVSDNGAGVPEEYKEKIFEKFVQVKGKKEKVRAGTGLGLTFCKMVAESHGGSIKVESEEGKGSAFIILIPKRGQ